MPLEHNSSRSAAIPAARDLPSQLAQAYREGSHWLRDLVESAESILGTAAAAESFLMFLWMMIQWFIGYDLPSDAMYCGDDPDSISCKIFHADNLGSAVTSYKQDFGTYTMAKSDFLDSGIWIQVVLITLYLVAHFTGRSLNRKARERYHAPLEGNEPPGRLNSWFVSPLGQLRVLNPAILFASAIPPMIQAYLNRFMSLANDLLLPQIQTGANITAAFFSPISVINPALDGESVVCFDGKTSFERNKDCITLTLETVRESFSNSFSSLVASSSCRFAKNAMLVLAFTAAILQFIVFPLLRRYLANQSKHDPDKKINRAMETLAKARAKLAELTVILQQQGLVSTPLLTERQSMTALVAEHGSDIVVNLELIIQQLKQERYGSILPPMTLRFALGEDQLKNDGEEDMLMTEDQLTYSSSDS